MKWGLVPHYVDDPTAFTKKYSTFNAKAETASRLPSFRGPMRSRRCVVPCDAFFEWQLQADGKTKIKYRLERTDGDLILLAGLWDQWERGSESLLTCTVVVTEANKLLSEIHNTKKRMPVILEPDQVPAWIDPETPLQDAQTMMAPQVDGMLRATK